MYHPSDKERFAIQTDFFTLFLRQNQPPVTVNFGRKRLAVDHPFQQFALHRAARQQINLAINLVDCLNRITFKEFAAVITIYNDQLRAQALFPIRIACFQNTAKQGRDRHPALSIHLMVGFASESACHCPGGSC